MKLFSTLDLMSDADKDYLNQQYINRLHNVLEQLRPILSNNRDVDFIFWSKIDCKDKIYRSVKFSVKDCSIFSSL